MKNSYPTKFHNFSNGVHVSDDEINQWIKKIKKRIKKRIKKGKKFSYFSTGTGNSMVIGVSYLLKGYDEHEVIIRVIKGYHEYSKFIKIKK